MPVDDGADDVLLALATGRDEDASLRATALQNIKSIQAARNKAEADLRAAQAELRQAVAALQDEMQKLDELQRMTAMLASTLDQEKLLQGITDAATKLCGAQFGAFFYNVKDPDTGNAYMLYTLTGAPRAAFERFGHPRATPMFGPTFAGQGPVRLDDVRTDPRYGQWGPHHGMPKGHLPVVSYLAVPVVARSAEVLGGLFFGHGEPSKFSQGTERVVVALATIAGIAIDNARLYDVAQKDARERMRLLESERAVRIEAERASRMKDEFLSTLSHELRTPLTAILGWANMLASRTTDADSRRGLAVIERNARAQTQLVEDLLDMSRITAGQLRLDIQPIDPRAAVEAALETIRPAIEAKELRIEKVLDPVAVRVHGDASRLQQIVWNLLSNAVKFTPRGGKIQITLQRVNSHVEIVVADTGQGITAEFLPFVFDRFRQQDSSFSRKFGGLGLGLSIVKHLVELHGGTVHVRSDGTDKGATFAVHLPVSVARLPEPIDDTHRAHPAAPDNAAPPRSFRDCALRGVRILLVDDDLDGRELLAELLQACGAEVKTAPGARPALSLAKEQSFDVIISDIGMPGMDGYELIEEIRRLPPLQNGRTPAIALTAYTRSEDRTRSMLAGYSIHMSKPVEAAELTATVANLVGRATGR